MWSLRITPRLLRPADARPDTNNNRRRAITGEDWDSQEGWESIPIPELDTYGQESDTSARTLLANLSAPKFGYTYLKIANMIQTPT